MKYVSDISRKDNQSAHFVNFTVSQCILYHKVLIVPTYALVFMSH